MKRIASLLAIPLLTASLGAQSTSAQPETPLFALPYSPSLDVTSMDRSASPCVDFYRFACGGWNKNNPIPSDQSRWDVYSKLANENERFLWGILQQASQVSPSRGPVAAQIGDYFQSCMDESAIEKSGGMPLQPDLAAIAALKNLRELPALLGRLHAAELNNNILFGLGSGQDYADSTRVIAFLGAGGLGLPDRDYYTKTDAKSQEIRQRYVEHVAAMLALSGEPGEKARADAAGVMAIETALAQASLTRVEQRDPYKLFHPYSVAKLQALTPAFAWKRYFSSIGMTQQARINVTEPAFFAEMQKLLQEHNLDDWKTYLRWELIHAKAQFLAPAFVTANFDFYRRYLRGVQTMPPRWKRCVQMVDQQLGEALGEIFVQKTFSADTKARAVKMTKEIEDAMRREIEQLPWMSSETKKRALEKLQVVANKIG